MSLKNPRIRRHLVAHLFAAGLLAPLPTLASDHAPAKAAPAPAKAAEAAKVAPLPAAAATPGTPPAAPVAAPAPAAADPLDQLRQRLADRLSGSGRPSEASNELRVVARLPETPPPAAKAAAGARAARAGGHGAAVASAVARGADAHAAHWAYNGNAGPASWGALKPEFSLCGAGQRQSPIDIRGGLSVDLDPVRFDYKASRFGVIDNGHTVQANIAPGNSIEIGGKRYELLQFHFHRPSEERIDGRQFEMSLHLVHKDDQGKLAVVALLLDKGPAQPAVQKVWNNLPLERNDEMQAKTLLDVAELLPSDRRYFTYMGSLTTPPCSEGVQWIVMRQPVSVTPEQIEIFARMYPMNARPIQALAGRRIIQSN